MKSDIADKLKAILDDREKQKQESAHLAAERQNAVAKSVADWEAKKKDLIKPALQEIVDLYKAKGVSLNITEEQEQLSNRSGGYHSASMGIDMAGAYPGSYSDMKPQFTLSFDKNNRTLSLYTSTRSQAGPAGTVGLDAITADWIHAAFLKYEGGK